jgi:hypothetical protein
MGYVCLSCYEEYEKDGLNLERSSGYQYKCPKVTCGDLSVAEVDDLIMPIIIELNKKGYMTEFCCSNHGHCYDMGSTSNTYIAFQEDYVPNVIPKGFVLEDDDYYMDKYKQHRTGEMVCMRKTYKSEKSSIKLHMEILKTMIELGKWVNKLEDINE